MNLLNLLFRVGVQDEATEGINQISDSVVGKLAGAAKTAAKAFAGAFAVKKVVDFGKAAYDSYASFQQLTGGIDKLYGAASDKMKAYAQSAVLGTGMDANSYMESVTGFSAALINSLGQDTDKAADVADMAMRDIADNANMYGKYSAEELTNVYQNLAKGQFQTLDNLQLGYGGSKEGMQQLIDKANQLKEANGEMGNLSIDSFADMVEAIHLVQNELNITGTTEKEALNTLEGSANAAKAAWKNLVTEFGKPEADIGARVSEMLTVLFGNEKGKGLIRNAAEEIGHIARNIITALSDGISIGADWLLTNGADKLREGIKGMVSKIGDVTEVVKNLPNIDIGELLFGRSEGGDGILARVGDLITDVSEIIYDHMPDIQAAFGGLWEALTTYIAEHGPEVLASIGEVLSGIGEWLITWWPEIQGWLADTWLSLMEWLYSNGPEILQTIGEIIDSIVSWLWENAPLILQAVGETMMNVVMAIAEHAPEILTSIAEMVGTVIGYLIEHAGEFLIAAGDWIAQMVQGIQDKGPEILTWFQELPQNILNALGDLGGLLLDAGAQIVNGLVKGITDNIGDAGQALLDGIGGAVDGALSFLGIASPSKLFDWVGKMSMEGLAGGIEDAAAKAEAATASAVQGVYGAASGTIDVSMAPSGNNAILAALGEIRDNMNMSVTLDSGALVGGIAPQMNTALGGIY